MTIAPKRHRHPMFIFDKSIMVSLRTDDVRDRQQNDPSDDSADKSGRLDAIKIEIILEDDLIESSPNQRTDDTQNDRADQTEAMVSR